MRICPLWDPVSEVSKESKCNCVCTHGGRVHTSQRSLLSLARTVRRFAHFFRSDLCSTLLLFRCIRGGESRGTKNPTATRHIGNCASGNELFRFGAGLAPRCCPFPVSSTVTVVNASLAQRISHYTGSSINPASACAPPAAQVGCHPSGVGRLKVNASWLDRATTIRTGSAGETFISMCTRCGGTQTKSPACASWPWSS
jgi:hypothetical protein